MDEFHRRDTCRLCGEKKLQSVIKFVPTPVGDAYLPKEHLQDEEETYPVELFLCLYCGHAQLSDIISPKKIYQEYIYKTADSLGLVEHFQKYVESVIQKIQPQKGDLVIDIGSNDGSVLQFFKNHGLHVLGIDPAKVISEEANKKGIETINDFFTVKLANDIKAKYKQASIIISNNTFANIDNADDFIDGIKLVLDKQGVFVFETGYALDTFQKCVIDNIYHEHLSYFSIRPLKKFFERKGMDLFYVEREKTKAGSIRCMVQFKNGNRKQDPSVHDIMELEQDVGLQEPEYFYKFKNDLEHTKQNTLNLLKRLKKRNKKIIGYGASVGVTTIMYEFGIGKNFIDFCVDDNVRRQNLFSPGMHLPVLSPQEIYSQKADYVLILAWQYSDPIIKKHKAFLEQGGKCIVILPQLLVIDKSYFLEK
jgi:SAM-dependent methyltransferase